MVKKRQKNYMTPTRGIYLLHSLHGQLSGCHFFMCVLKEVASSNSFSVLGTKFHMLGPKLEKLSDP